MKKIITVSVLFLLVSFGFCQDLYKATSGEISFFSETPVEDIYADNKKIKGVMSIKSNSLAFVVPIIQFRFKKPLMEEHFNENYMETDKGVEYKTAIFKGKIIGDIDYTKDGEYNAIAKGTLKIHAVAQEREITGKVIVKDGKVILESEFDVKLKDHKIKIPKIVIKNIAETVKVNVNIIFEPK